jgi:alpha-tubulin suppressor-like RCC1 family protein
MHDVRNGPDPERRPVLRSSPKRRSSLFYALVIVGALLGCGLLVCGGFFWLVKTAYAPQCFYQAGRYGVLDSARVIALGESYSLAVKHDGTLWSWGSDTSGQLGLGALDPTWTSVPARVGKDSDWAAVVAGSAHALALKSNGTLWAWGAGTRGQVGDGALTDRSATVQVGQGARWTHVAAGTEHSLALRSDGTLWAWGANSFGQLGDGTATDRAAPVRVGSGRKWASVSAAGTRTLAIASDGSLWAWGQDSAGLLGAVDATAIPNPTRVGSDSDWTNVFPGWGRTFAIKTDGSLWEWRRSGEETSGTAGIGGAPTRVGTDTGWLSVGVGSGSIVAVKSDGTLWAWGFQPMTAELGNAWTPVRLGSGSDWTAVAAAAQGYSDTLAIKADGSVWTIRLKDGLRP